MIIVNSQKPFKNKSIFDPLDSVEISLIKILKKELFKDVRIHFSKLYKKE
jgi:hypothetical protein